jgi:1-phosphatidylinositol-3-phosphate 5-kinase
LQAVVHNLVESSAILSTDKAEWKEIILTLIKVVVSSVDPDVRSGDNIDIRPYVKIKVIPGGHMSECVYVDGVVFRKNVSHKKMAVERSKDNPKILLLAGGIEFQRTEAKLSSMDTLIEQEDKYMEILVNKIMSLKPGTFSFFLKLFTFNEFLLTMMLLI